MNLLKRSANHLIIRKYIPQCIGQKCQFSDQQIRLSYYNITPINANEGQNEPPVLIFHGLFGSKNNWKSISKSIAGRTGRSVYAFDLRNHGSSPHTSGHESTLRLMASDINLFMDENNYTVATLLGHSLGGRVVMQFAFDMPERVENLISVDITPFPSLPSAFFLNTGFIDVMKKSIENLPNLSLPEARRQVDERLKPVIKDQFIRGFFLMSLDKDESGKVVWKFNLDAIQHMIDDQLVSQIEPKPFTGKSLLIHGQDSEYVKQTDYEAIRQLMPNIKFVSIPGTGHYLHVEKPNQFVDSVIEFLKSY